MNKPTNRSMCVYCDQREGTTDDHVIPKSVFLPPLAGNMVTVPACLTCNGEKSKDDEFLRDILLVDWENETHPMAQGELKEKLIRSIGRNRSQLIREGRNTRQATPFHSPAGVYLCTAPAIPIDQARINLMFARMVRGLYYRFTDKTRLPTDSTFEVGKVHPMAKERTLRIFDRPGARMYAMGNSFDCVYVIPKDDPTVSVWLLRLLNVFVFVATNADKHRGSFHVERFHNL
jgi:hypothetical protein